MPHKPQNPKPVAQKREAFGKSWEDPFLSLENIDDPKTQAWLLAEKQHAETEFSVLNPLRRELFDEMCTLIGEDEQSAHYRIGKYEYYERFEKGFEYAVHYREKHGEEQVVFDPNVMARNYKKFRPGSLSISPNSDWVLFAVDTTGEMEYTLGIRNIETGEILPDSIHGVTPETAWGGDSMTVFYTVVNPRSQRPYRIYRHILGTDAMEDEMVFEETDPSYRCYVRQTRNHQFLLIYSNSAHCDEVRFLCSDNPMGTFTIFCPRSESLKYTLQHYRDRFYLHTNYLAPNYRLMVALPGVTPPVEWKEVVAYRPEIVLADYRVLGDYLILSEWVEGLTRLHVVNLESSEEHYIKFSEPAYKAHIGVSPMTETPVLRLEYASINTPPTTYDYSLDTREKRLVQRRKIPGFMPEKYLVERVEVPSRDGITVPMTLAYRNDLKKDGRAPALIYGYGAYGHTVAIDFKPSIIALLNRGFVYAIAHVRGGGCRGGAWYSAGKLQHKKNTFYDYLDCVHYLTKQGYADPANLFAYGESAGGLLVGAVLNLAPNMFKGAVMTVPFVDVLAAMVDSNLPLTSAEYDEWGNPDDSRLFDYILSYSPYQNIKNQSYPHLLVTTGLRDTRVPYWQGCKWVARLKAEKTDQHQVLLNFDMDTGHDGAAGRYRRFWDVALENAFVLQLAGVTDSSCRQKV